MPLNIRFVGNNLSNTMPAIFEDNADLSYGISNTMPAQINMNSDRTEGFGDNPMPITAQMAAGGAIGAHLLTGGGIGVAMGGTAFAVSPIGVMVLGAVAVGGLTAAVLKQIE